VACRVPPSARSQELIAFHPNRYQYETYNKQLGHLKIDTGKSKGLNWDDVQEAAKEDDLAQTVRSK